MGRSWRVIVPIGLWHFAKVESLVLSTEKKLYSGRNYLRYAELILSKVNHDFLIGIKQTGMEELIMVEYMAFGRGPTLGVCGIGKTYWVKQESILIPCVHGMDILLLQRNWILL